ncbi:MAG: hypothetical protein M9921_00215 [Fimbriimonadaceae bacterium]|nr:hypothetical protein [Chthonomonadaceae bacterium]MCO5295260.1 hypothetical protein [Fimbriimonadaceae bacterium]
MRIGILALIAAVGAFAPLGSLDQTAGLPGLTSKDAFPKGCVSCHVVVEGQDHRLSALLAKVKGHPKLKAGVAVPTECAKCHRAESPLGEIGSLLHRAHYARLEESEFVKKFQGACLNCHTLDSKTGKMGLKTGPLQ